MWGPVVRFERSSLPGSRPNFFQVQPRKNGKTEPKRGLDVPKWAANLVLFEKASEFRFFNGLDGSVDPAYPLRGGDRLNWYIRLADGRIQGPYKEVQIRRGIQQGTIRAEMMIRQANSAWIDAIRVKQLFDRLDNEGFYLRFASGEVAGPFTEERVRSMSASGDLPPVFLIRRGKSAAWTTLDTGSNRSGSVAAASLPQDACATDLRREPRRKIAGAGPNVAPTPPIARKPGVALVTDTPPKPSGTTSSNVAQLEPSAVGTGSRPAIPAAPVMKLRCNTWIERWKALMDQLATLVLGDPLDGRNAAFDNAVTTASEFQQTHPAESGIPPLHHRRSVQQPFHPEN